MADQDITLPKEIDALFDVQALVASARGMCKPGDPADRVLSMAVVMLDGITDRLDQLELALAGAPLSSAA